MVYFLLLSSLIAKTNIAKAIIRLNTSKVDNSGSPFSRLDTYTHKHHLLEMDCHHLFTFLQNILYRNFLSQTRLNCTKLPSQSGTYITILGCSPFPVSAGGLCNKFSLTGSRDNYEPYVTGKESNLAPF